MVAGGGGRWGDGPVLLWVRRVFAHEEAFFEVAAGAGVEFAFEEGFVAGVLVSYVGGMDGWMDGWKEGRIYGLGGWQQTSVLTL